MWLCCPSHRELKLNYIARPKVKVNFPEKTFKYNNSNKVLEACGSSVGNVTYYNVLFAHTRLLTKNSSSISDFLLSKIY